VQANAGVGELDAAALADKELAAEAALERPDVLGDGGLDDVELTGDFRDAARFGDSTEDVELAQRYAAVEQGASPSRLRAIGETLSEARELDVVP
jgi:hypothetical protein